MTIQLPDVQAGEPDVEVGLSQVGVTGVEKLVELSDSDSLGPEERPLVLTAEFEVYVDLPQGRKGIDMSRNMEVIEETLESALDDTPSRVEDLCGIAAQRLLEKHDYTSTATVKMEAEYMVREETPASRRSTQGTVDMIASATATEDEPLREEVGVRVTGMTVCPCSQQMMSGRAGEKLRELGVDGEKIHEFLDEIPQAGHSQRGHATISLETTGGTDVDIRDIVDVARDAMSARIYNMAKRPDEDHMTYHAHANARFVEDCVRAMAEGVVDTFRDLPGGTVVTVKQRNEESIHQHDAHAQRVATLGDLREEVD